MKNRLHKVYVASLVIYKRAICGDFGVKEKSLRPSEPEIAFCAFALVVNQFFDDNLKSIHFRAYVASQVIYKCDLCGYFGVFKKSLRPSEAEIAFCAFALVINQFFDENLKSIHFRAYVASQVIYKCDLCGYFGVFKKSLRPS